MFQSIQNLSTGLKFYLLQDLQAENSFPIDKLGNFRFKYKTTTYQVQGYVIKQSRYLMQAFKDKNDNLDVEINLKSGESEIVFGVIMKLLFGFKEVVLPKEYYIEFYEMFNELGNRSISSPYDLN